MQTHSRKWNEHIALIFVLGLIYRNYFHIYKLLNLIKFVKVLSLSLSPQIQGMWWAILAHLAGVLFQGKCFSFLSLDRFHHLAMKRKMKKVIVINVHLLNFSNFVFHRGMKNLYPPPPWSQSIEWWENGERWNPHPPRVFSSAILPTSFPLEAPISTHFAKPSLGRFYGWV